MIDIVTEKEKDPAVKKVLVELAGLEGPKKSRRSEHYRVLDAMRGEKREKAVQRGRALIDTVTTQWSPALSA